MRRRRAFKKGGRCLTRRSRNELRSRPRWKSLASRASLSISAECLSRWKGNVSLLSGLQAASGFASFFHIHNKSSLLTSDVIIFALCTSEKDGLVVHTFIDRARFCSPPEGSEVQKERSVPWLRSSGTKLGDKVMPVSQSNFLRHHNPSHFDALVLFY